jgi:hypothetical protein
MPLPSAVHNTAVLLMILLTPVVTGMFLLLKAQHPKLMIIGNPVWPFV